jgi:hypothetical protein
MTMAVAGRTRRSYAPLRRFSDSVLAGGTSFGQAVKDRSAGAGKYRGPRKVAGAPAT